MLTDPYPFFKVQLTSHSMAVLSWILNSASQCTPALHKVNTLGGGGGDIMDLLHVDKMEEITYMVKVGKI